MIVLTILVVAASLFSQMVVSTSGLRIVNRENATAAEAARVKLEEMRNEPFDQVYFLFNPDPSDDPGGAGTGPGNYDSVDGLELLDGSASGFHLEIFFPVFPPEEPSKLDGTQWEYDDTRSGTPSGVSAGSTTTSTTTAEVEEFWELREDFTEPKLGMPRDLNGDSIIDAENHAEDYTLLPIHIRVEWQGVRGPRSFDLYTMLTEFIK